MFYTRQKCCTIVSSLIISFNFCAKKITGSFTCGPMSAGFYRNGMLQKMAEIPWAMDSSKLNSVTTQWFLCRTNKGLSTHQKLCPSESQKVETTVIKFAQITHLLLLYLHISPADPVLHTSNFLWTQRPNWRTFLGLAKLVKVHSGSCTKTLTGAAIANEGFMAKRMEILLGKW
jgi:hypothetical protein